MSQMFARFGITVGLVAGLALSANALASPIEFVFTGSGSGTIGDTSFTDAAFTITQYSDTSGLAGCPVSSPTCVYIDATTADISIAGVGDYSLTSGTRAFSDDGQVGFSRAGNDGDDLYDSFAVTAGYNLTTSYGPDYGEACLLQWGDGYSPVTTSDGTLVFDGGCSDGYFQAIAGAATPPTPGVPEPATFSLLVLGLAGLGFMRGRKAT